MAGLFKEKRAAKDALDADVKAGALGAAVEVAIGHWIRGGERASLASLFRQTLDRLRKLC